MNTIRIIGFHFINYIMKIPLIFILLKTTYLFIETINTTRYKITEKELVVEFILRRNISCWGILLPSSNFKSTDINYELSFTKGSKEDANSYHCERAPVLKNLGNNIFGILFYGLLRTEKNPKVLSISFNTSIINRFQGSNLNIGYCLENTSYVGPQFLKTGFILKFLGSDQNLKMTDTETTSLPLIDSNWNDVLFAAKEIYFENFYLPIISLVLFIFFMILLIMLSRINYGLKETDTVNIFLSDIK